MLNRLSGNSLRLRVGLAIAMFSGCASSVFFGWGYVTAGVAVVCGVIAAIAVGDRL